MDWYIGVLKKYVEFGGRARRKEYWMFFLINFIIAIILAIVDVTVLGSSGDGSNPSIGMLSFIYSLAVLVPSVAVAVRRLHDIGRTGWWLLIAFIPVVGGIVLLIFAVLDGTPGDNEYGPNPKAAAA